MKAKILPYLVGLLMVGCTNHAKKESIASKDSIAKIDTPKERNYLEETLATVPKGAKPIMGYRFVIKGDFDGDGKKETLTEHYVSGVDGKETNKFYSEISDNGQLIALQDKKEPNSFIMCSNAKVDTFYLGTKGNGQLLGLLLLRNEGDLNGDGNEEVSYIRQYADWSSLNSLHIITFTDSGWKELYSTICYDEDAPELFYIDIEKRNWNRILYVNVNTLKNYKSRIKKIKPGIIKVQTYGEGMAYETVDTVKIPRIIK